MKIYLIFCIFLMAVFAVLQVNDLDPHIWIPLYGIVAFLGYRRLKMQDVAFVYYIVAILYVLMALIYIPAAWEGVLLDEMGMKTVNIELARESLGLSIAALILFSFGISLKK